VFDFAITQLGLAVAVVVSSIEKISTLRTLHTTMTYRDNTYTSYTIFS